MVCAVRVIATYQLMSDAHTLCVHKRAHTLTSLQWCKLAEVTLLGLVSFMVSDFENKQSQHCTAEAEKAREGEIDWK